MRRTPVARRRSLARYRKMSVPQILRTMKPGETPADERFFFTPGNLGFPVFDTPFGVRIGILICYDRHFPEAARILGLKGAHLLLVPTATYRDSIRDVWEAELRGHAIANMFYVHRPYLQSRSLQNPMISLEEGDYRYFERFSADIEDYLKPYIPDGGGREPRGIDINKVMTESLRFSSDPDAGLEMVDIVVNATRRALSGRLRFQGWRGIPGLMIDRPGRHYIQVLSMTTAIPIGGQWPYMRVLDHFNHGGKSMWAPRFDKLHA